MLKFVIKKPNQFRLLRSIPIVRNVFVFHVSHLLDITEAEIYDDAVCTISTSNNTMKSTMGNRFADLNDVLIKYFRQNDRYTIHDVAVSSGVTSVALHNFLLNNGIDFALSISDKFSMYHTQGSTLCKVVDADFVPAFYYFCGIYFDSVLSWKFPISKYVYFFLKKIKFKKSAGFKDILLFDPNVVALINNGKIQKLNYDIFTTAIFDKFSFVRCMNILNKAYFDDENILRGIKNICLSLHERGILQIGRTHNNGVNHVSFYRKEGEKLELLEDLNDGSELKEYIALLNSR